MSESLKNRESMNESLNNFTILFKNTHSEYYGLLDFAVDLLCFLTEQSQ